MPSQPLPTTSRHLTIPLFEDIRSPTVRTPCTVGVTAACPRLSFCSSFMVNSLQYFSVPPVVECELYLALRPNLVLDSFSFAFSLSRERRTLR
jgi:hypothetical protein